MTHAQQPVIGGRPSCAALALYSMRTCKLLAIHAHMQVTRTTASLVCKGYLCPAGRTAGCPASCRAGRPALSNCMYCLAHGDTKLLQHQGHRSHRMREFRKHIVLCWVQERLRWRHLAQRCTSFGPLPLMSISGRLRKVCMHFEDNIQQPGGPRLDQCGEAARTRRQPKYRRHTHHSSKRR